MNPTTLPAFPLGYPVNVGYMGLYRVDERPTTRDGSPVSPGYTIQGVCLIPEAVDIYADGDGPDGYAVTYPKGWEYLAGRFDHTGRWRDGGWHTEAELLKAGYVPPGAAETERAAADVDAVYLAGAR